jgi:hypothetical protein
MSDAELDEAFPPLSDAEMAELEQRYEDEFTPSGRRRSPEQVARRRAQRVEAANSSSSRATKVRAGRSGGRGRPVTGRGRRRPTRRSGVVGRSYRRAARQLEAPIERQLVSGMRVIGLTVGLTALYLVLTNAGPFSGVLNGVNRAMLWLADPDRSIPYAPGSAG